MVGEEEKLVENSVESTWEESARKANAVAEDAGTRGPKRPRQLVREKKVDLRHQLGEFWEGRAPGCKLGHQSGPALAGAGFWVLFSRLFVPPRPSVRLRPGVGVSGVQCPYDSGWETHKRVVVPGAQWASCRILVKPRDQSEKRAEPRVHHPGQGNHSFTVTMQELRQDDTDTYWCGIENPGANLRTQIKVTVAPSKRPPCPAPGPWCSGLEE